MILPIQEENIVEQMKAYGSSAPFDHCIIDNFFKDDVVAKIVDEFPQFDDNVWHEYNNPLEIKKTCNNWNNFPSTTYSVFEYLNSENFLNFLNRYTGLPKLYADPGLNGGGWHIHSSGGKLNTHLDYSIHPKLNRQRVLNLLIYVTPDWQEEWGGNLGLWNSIEGQNKPGELSKTISPKFNRAVIFNTAQNSWHGLPEPINCPITQYRRSLAVYYLTEPLAEAPTHGKAMFVPSQSQLNNPEIEKLIEKRSSVEHANDVYKT